jgi:hypothetical protein
MKFSIAKSLVAAAVAATLGSAASAAPIPSTGLFFSAYNGNPDAPSSIVINLGVTAAEFLAAPSQSYSLNGIDTGLLSNWLGSLNPANLSTLQWGIYANSAAAPSAQPTPDYYFLSTATSGVETDSNWGLFNGLEGVIGSQIPSFLSNPTLGPAQLNASTNTYSANNVNQSFQAEEGGVGFESQAGLNQSATFYRFFADQEPGLEYFQGDYIQYLSWTLSYSGGLASLGYGGNAPEVPVPAAVWLFASGLLGMAGVSRRKAKAQAAA